MSYIDEILNNSVYELEILRLFYLEQISSFEIRNLSDEQLETVAIRLFEILKKTRIEDIIQMIESNRNYIHGITAANIPQFSNVNLINDVLRFCVGAPKISFELVGYFLNKNSTVVAQKKYGENHYKLASLIGLVKPPPIYGITFLGKHYFKLIDKDQRIIRSRLFLLVPIVQTVLVDAKYNEVVVYDKLCEYLSSTTADRRKSNIRVIIDEICENIDDINLLAKYGENLVWTN